MIENVSDLLCTFWDPQLDGTRPFIISREKYELHRFMCVFLNVDEFGDWSSEGCRRDESYNISDDFVTCYCNHLFW